MNSLETILSQNEEFHHNSVVKYYNFCKNNFPDEEIEAIFVAEGFYPDSIIITNKSFLFCIQKNLGTEVQVHISMPLFEFARYSIAEGIITDDITVWIGGSNVCHLVSSFTKKTTFNIKLRFDVLIAKHKIFWEEILNNYK